MTEKFKKVSQELDKLCVKTNNVKTRRRARALSLKKWKAINVKTRRRARALSLKKWKAIRKMSGMFFDEFKVRCGFCGYGEYKSAEKAVKAGHFIDRCENCGVKTICDLMCEKVRKLHDETDELIDGLITHFENMKVADR